MFEHHWCSRLISGALLRDTSSGTGGWLEQMQCCWRIKLESAACKDSFLLTDLSLLLPEKKSLSRVSVAVLIILSAICKQPNVSALPCERKVLVALGVPKVGLDFDYFDPKRTVWIIALKLVIFSYYAFLALPSQCHFS